MNCSTTSVKKLNVLLQRPSFTKKEVEQKGWKKEFKESLPVWNQEFLNQPPIAVSPSFAVDQHPKSNDWKLEFQKTLPTSVTEWTTEFKRECKTEKLDWESEFSKLELEAPQNAPQNEVAQTASCIVNALSGHDKLSNSSFMDFMVKLKNSELVIEKDRLVHPIEPFKEAQGLIGKVSWEEEFNLEPRQKEWSAEFRQQDKFKQENKKNDEWTREFNNHEWKHEFLQQNREFNQEFWDYNGKTHQDWLKEFDQEIQNLKIDKFDPLMDQMDQLDKKEKTFLDTYAFSPFNPYLKQTPLELSDFLENSSVKQVSSERILRLEALLQQSCANSNSSLWHQLGMAQQENENDLYAIAALKNAVSLNPAQLESWLLLSASYTNENFKTEACWALQSWFMHHREYSKLLVPMTEPASLEQRQKLLLNTYLNAVRSSNLIDADIQVISEQITSDWDGDTFNHEE